MLFDKEEKAKAFFSLSKELEECKEEKQELDEKYQKLLVLIQSERKQLKALLNENTSTNLLKVLSPILSPLLNSPNLSEEVKVNLNSLLEKCIDSILRSQILH